MTGFSWEYLGLRVTFVHRDAPALKGLSQHLSFVRVL
jgi:hypothetical protein